MTVIGLTTYAEPARMLVWQREFAMLHATYVVGDRTGGWHRRAPAAAGAPGRMRCSTASTAWC